MAGKELALAMTLWSLALAENCQHVNQSPIDKCMSTVFSVDDPNYETNSYKFFCDYENNKAMEANYTTGNCTGQALTRVSEMNNLYPINCDKSLPTCEYGLWTSVQYLDSAQCQGQVEVTYQWWILDVECLPFDSFEAAYLKTTCSPTAGYVRHFYSDDKCTVELKDDELVYDAGCSLNNINTDDSFVCGVSRNAYKECNHINTKAVGVCTTIATASSLTSLKYWCNAAGESQLSRWYAQDCSGDAADVTALSTTNYNCDAKVNCDYMLQRVVNYQNSCNGGNPIGNYTFAIVTNSCLFNQAAADYVSTTCSETNGKVTEHFSDSECKTAVANSRVQVAPGCDGGTLKYSFDCDPKASHSVSNFLFSLLATTVFAHLFFTL